MHDARRPHPIHRHKKYSRIFRSRSVAQLRSELGEKKEDFSSETQIDRKWQGEQSHVLILWIGCLFEELAFTLGLFDRNCRLGPYVRDFKILWINSMFYWDACGMPIPTFGISTFARAGIASWYELLLGIEHSCMPKCMPTHVRVKAVD